MNKRLTDNEFHTKENKERACYIQEPRLQAIYDKLFELEDIEEELGIDLVALFKALSGSYAVKEDDGSISVEWSCPRFYAPALLSKDFIGFICIRQRGIDEKTLYLKDYGKTWALTKEELESASI